MIVARFCKDGFRIASRVSKGEFQGDSVDYRMFTWISGGVMRGLKTFQWIPGVFWRFKVASEEFKASIWKI